MLAQELLDIILSNLRGTSSIRECALVCRGWRRIARKYLLPPSEYLKIGHTGWSQFLELYDAPFSTLSFVSFKWLDIGIVHRRKLVDKFFTRNLSFQSQLTRLSINLVMIESLSPEALASLYRSFTSLKFLRLLVQGIDRCDLFSDLITIQSLETLSLRAPDPNRFENSLDFGSQKKHHPNLRKLVFEGYIPECIIRLFARNIVYDAGINSISVEALTPQFSALKELLEVAGDNLQELFVQTKDTFNNSRDANIQASWAQVMKLEYNPNLEKIHLDFVDNATIRRFMRGLISNPKIHLDLLTINLRDNEHTPYPSTPTWTLMDQGLYENFSQTPTHGLKSLLKVIFPLPPRYEIQGGDSEDDFEANEDLRYSFREAAQSRCASRLANASQNWEIMVDVRSV
ncbi:hypothetical protein H0H93_006830 [Arthromyces matolae]|nr:hypothetical protein H0H93_006830 [Arthromyces matolae]